MIKIENHKFVFPDHRVEYHKLYFVTNFVGQKRETILCCGFCHKPVHLAVFSGRGTMWRHNPR